MGISEEAAALYANDPSAVTYGIELVAADTDGAHVKMVIQSFPVQPASGPLCTRECFALANLFDLSHPQVPHRLETDDCVGCLVDDDCSAKALRDSAFHPGQGVLTLEPVDVRVDKVFVSDAVDANMYPDGGALPNVETLQRRSPQTTDTFLRKDPREYPKKL